MAARAGPSSSPHRFPNPDSGIDALTLADRPAPTSIRPDHPLRARSASRSRGPARLSHRPRARKRAGRVFVPRRHPVGRWAGAHHLHLASQRKKMPHNHAGARAVVAWFLEPPGKLAVRCAVTGTIKAAAFLLSQLSLNQSGHTPHQRPADSRPPANCCLEMPALDKVRRLANLSIMSEVFGTAFGSDSPPRIAASAQGADARASSAASSTSPSRRYCTLRGAEGGRSGAHRENRQVRHLSPEALGARRRCWASPTRSALARKRRCPKKETAR